MGRGETVPSDLLVTPLMILRRAAPRRDGRYADDCESIGEEMRCESRRDPDVSFELRGEQPALPAWISAAREDQVA